MRKFLFASAIAMLLANSAWAVEFEDIMGRWCVDNGNYNDFSQSKLTVIFPDGNKRILRIGKVEVNGDKILIEWADNTYTQYKLYPNKRTLIQLPANTPEKSTPRRVLKRCEEDDRDQDRNQDQDRDQDQGQDRGGGRNHYRD